MGPPPWWPLLVAAGGAAGALARHAVTSALDGSPGVVAVNLAGSLLLGWIWRRASDRPPLGLALGTGFCGGLTTMSTFALDVARRLDGGDGIGAAGVVAVTVAVTVGGFVAGRRLDGALPGPDRDRVAGAGGGSP